MAIEEYFILSVDMLGADKDRILPIHVSLLCIRIQYVCATPKNTRNGGFGSIRDI